MSISCALGLVACLNYNDTTVDWDEAFNIVEVCSYMDGYPANDFMGGSYNGKAYWQAETLWDLGLRFEWNPPSKASSEYSRMVFRKASVLKECRRFRTLYQNISNWENPEKVL
jgi:hypothetical protein